MAMQDLSHLAEAFNALQEGTLLSRLDEFTDEQLHPFLPALFVASFSSNGVASNDDRLLARVVSFEEANRLQSLCSLPFAAIEKEIRKTTIFGVAVTGQRLRVGTDEERMRALCMKLTEPEDMDDDGTELYPFVADDVIYEASLLICVLSLVNPGLCLPDRLVSLAVTHQNAADVMARVVANTPEILLPVLSSLCNLTVRGGEETPRGKQRAHAISLLLSLSPGSAPFVLSILFNGKTDCILALRLACQFLDDESLLSFLSSEMLNRSRPLGQLLHRSAARQSMYALYQRLALIAQNFLNNRMVVEDKSCLLLSICTLLSSSSYKPTAEDSELLFLFLIHSTTPPVADSHLIMTVCMIVALPNVNIVTVYTSRLIDWLKGLRAICEKDSSKHVSLSHTFIFIGTALVSQKTDQLVPFLSNILRLKVSLPPRHIAALRSLLNEAGLDERQFALMCMQQPITPGLSSNSSDVQVPVFCVNELLQANVFQKNGVSVTDWMERQLTSCTTPLHPIIGSLLDRLAISSVADGMLTLSIQFIEDSFSGPLSSRSSLPRRILSTIFLLSYRLHLDTARATDRGVERVQLYPHSLYTVIPLRYLLGVVEVLHSDYSHIRSWFTRLSSELFPYMQPSSHSVHIARTSLQEKEVEDGRINEDTLNRLLNSGQALMAMRRMESATLSEQVRLYSIVARCSSICLSPSSPRALVQLCTRLWMRLQEVVPRTIIESSAAQWLSTGGCKEIVPVSRLYQMPPLLFRVDPRIFTSPPHFACFLKALHFFQQAGRTSLGKTIAACGERDDLTKTERDIVSSTAEHSQTAAIVHLLLEVMDPLRFPSTKDLSRARLDELNTLICEQLHQMFIADRQLLRLVLWQLVPLHQLSSLVNYIPSLYVSLDFIHEMLANSDIHRRVFAVALAIQIAAKYRVAKSAKTLELVLDVLQSLQRLAPSALHLSLLNPLVPHLQIAITVFPQMAAEISHVLLSARAITKTRMALNCMVIPTWTPPENRLIDKIDDALVESINCVTITP